MDFQKEPKMNELPTEMKADEDLTAAELTDKIAKLNGLLDKKLNSDTIVCWGAGDGTVDLVSFLIDDNKFSEDEDKAYNYMGEKYDEWGTFMTLRDCRSTPIDVKELDDESDDESDDEGNDDLPPLEATSYENISKWFDEEEFDSTISWNSLIDYAGKQFECSFLPIGEPSLERIDIQNRHDWLYIKWSTFQKMNQDESEGEEEWGSNPPYFCDGGCGKKVGEGWNHACQRVCPDCIEEIDEMESAEAQENDDDIAFYCADCGMPIIRDSIAHDHSGTYNEDDWFCVDCYLKNEPDDSDDEGNDDLPPLEATSYENISKWFDEEEFDSTISWNSLIDYAGKQFECSFLPIGEPSLERIDIQNRHDWLSLKFKEHQKKKYDEEEDD